MDDDKLAKEYIEFVKSVNSDWTLPDMELKFPNITYTFDRFSAPIKNKKRGRTATKSAHESGVSASNKKGKPLCRA